MAAAGARAQKPVGSAAWISTEKENFMQLVDQEMEEVEYPVRHEMDWLNEHMAEVFSNNQPNFADVFKTPGKLRGKTPRTVRKRDANEPRVPLSEIFSSAHNNGKAENKLAASPAIQRSPTKTPAPATAAPATTTETKKTAEPTTQPQYPDLSQNLNSFPQYNTDSGYHGMPEEEEEEVDDDVVLTQVQTESQPSTQPMDQEPVAAEEQTNQPPEDRRTTGSSFHSAQEDVRPREETMEPVIIESSPKQNVGTSSPKKQPVTNESEPVSHAEPEIEDKPMPDLVPAQEQESESESEPEPEREDKPGLEPEHAPEPEPETEQEHEPEPVPQFTPRRESKPKEQFAPEPQPQPQSQPKPSKEVESASPLKTPAAQSPEPRKEDKDNGKDDMALDSLDDIGSPSEGSPARPLIRKSSLSFASLPAREPLMKKSLGGSRISRTSHLDFGKLSNTTGGYLGRQTGGHRTTQHALEDSTVHGDKMDVDDKKDGSDEESDADARASKLQTKSSTQLLHEKISMLGKLQPSRPTKSIPSVSGLSSAQVTYPELPTTKSDAKQETSSQKPRDTPAPEPSATDDDWIKPLNSPYRPDTRASQKADSMSKHSSARMAPAADENRHSVDREADAHVSEAPRASSKRTSDAARGKSSTPMYSSPQRPGHQKSTSANIDHQMSTTPVGSPAERYDGPLSASKSRLQSIVQSAKGLFTNTGGVAAAARMEAASPDAPRLRHKGRLDTDRMAGSQRPQSTQPPSPPRQEGRRTRSSTEREEKRRQKELEERQREEEQTERVRQQEKQRAMKLRATQEKSSADYEARASAAEPAAAPITQKVSQLQKPSKEIESTEPGPKLAAQIPASQQQASKQTDRRPLKPARELQKPKPQPVSIRVGSALSRQIPLASQVSSNPRESSVPAPTPASASKQPTLKKKASNSSLHTASSNSSFKSSISSQSQRKAQLASERKREQEEREARRREEQRRELERKRAAQQQEETRRQEMRSRAEAERRERLAAEDPKKAAHMQAIEKRRLENQRRLERQGSQQPEASQRSELGSARPASRLGSIQPFNRSINQPQPNPAKPPKRGLDDETSHRPTAPKTATMQPSGESKRRRTEDEQSRMSSMRPAMAPPIRQSNIRKPSIFGHTQPSVAHQSGSSIFKAAQAQRPAHPLDMAKYASGKIPFAEPSNAQPAAHRTPAASSSQKVPVKESPNYPNGENINLPEIATDSEDEDSDAEMLPVPKWAQPKELESLLRQQEGMEVDSIFGPIAPFSLEETFKSDKKIKKFRERTSSANWSGADGLTQEEIRRDLAERQRLRLNGGWSFN
ncbi:hypothetical protein BO94DRAFT_531547 [Aspergillus sclerotioniger CBS 115572]|uniref:Inner centromere protein ARK-binding domain-containing protein n=1 Tax=Aspergillus sclerotioniger CBS 115572 TaxID=1450535 RepID=A0A317XAF0_9EURO|nr:hypothetical protein BO94DRAFT_531547 [Aspergillus sclerotioniger CBS 115572]PWY94602.1 hypothetical protein BO94DRAFT_531547 [Aspergillus sclerotioniger CBS 115572]